MKAVICGANGAMGKLICGILGDEVVGRVSIDGENGVPKTFDELGAVEADVVVDFSHHTAISGVLDYAKKIGAAAVIGTTGHTEAEKALIFVAPGALTEASFRCILDGEKRRRWRWIWRIICRFTRNCRISSKGSFWIP